MKYPKINTIWKRDENNKFKIIEGEYSCPEFENILYWSVTEKIDGTNIRVYWDGKKVEFKGRTDKAEIPKPLMEQLIELFPVKKFIECFGTGDTNLAVLYGEGYGVKIQKGGNYRLDNSFILFDVWVDGWWLKQEDVTEIAEGMKIERTPIFYEKIRDMDIIAQIKGIPKSRIAQSIRPIEGFVARSNPLVLFRNGDPIMWKIKCKDYL